MSAHVLLNLINSITGAQMLDSIYHYDPKITFNSHFSREKHQDFAIYTPGYYGRQYITL